MQMMPQMGYDRAITVFSPDGRLFQVEYAREAVKRGTTAVGIKAKDGVVLLVDKRVTSRLLEAESIEKIFQIDEHIGVATSGLVADARALVDRGRVEAQINKVVYDEAIGVEVLAKKICDYKQTYTQFGGVRPFGTALLIAGVERDMVRLFETDPSGALLEYKATAIGAGRSEVMEYFEEHYDEDITLEDAILLGLDVLHSITEGRFDVDTIEVGVIELATKKFRMLDREELGGYLQTIRERHAEEEKEES
ncbi:MAG TPA: archaeal proteasome endopeptidase complex subunit alpha [Candidatus Syntrophoarchaeum butanivorans]|uniref:Proteasome subunit alpha n=1 Tax=Candidatus Syntropharchaeum butanivorans TaxID=1839936 RepID=A0A1F2P6U5_9EURY|nr:MAG: Proteasome, alpha subunit, archaeal [Candidatus Syntrophoarchaeum butanivorans]RJS71660.1 MAG: archaeal proteasome endopeptidase complex subunit alpha [Candidatus Syntrophoarchaeum sp. WYZ-LMO15]HDM35844.1 archaeal proteasome endopeptidase complex subunit alpha [Candidatus Syntrophoarchaeum butanivorans]HEC57521.1 archaeal proteasome endopeptidase complex subunit alpha [Candidatus Syntrophoarchaeum butanivorans]